MGSKKSYKNWNIEGIAESVIKEIKDDREVGDDITDEEYLEYVLEDHLRETYWSIYSREPKDAVIVVELVKEYIEEMEGLS